MNYVAKIEPRRRRTPCGCTCSTSSCTPGTAAGLGVAHTPTVAATAAIAEMVEMIAPRPFPWTTERFADTLEPADDDPSRQVLRLLGRDPSWPAAVSGAQPAVATS